jgi:cysteine-rich repeat protein
VNRVFPIWPRLARIVRQTGPLFLGLYWIVILSACTPPYVRVIIDDPNSIAEGTQGMRFELGSNAPLEVSLEEQSPKFPTSITLTAQNEGPRTLLITAYDSASNIIARAEALVDFRRTDSEERVVDLFPPCEGSDFVSTISGELDLRCDDGLFCNGNEFCRSGICTKGPPPCTEQIECVEKLCDEDANICMVTLHHQICDVFSNTDGSTSPAYCDESLGCARGSPCQENTDCQDSSFCNGSEICSQGRCESGIPPAEPAIDTRCLSSVCSEELEAWTTFPDPDGIDCIREETTDAGAPLLGVCVTGACELHSCGDGHLQDGMEECDDGDADNSNACTDLCLENICRDGFIFKGVEECDDGNDNPNDGCQNDCTFGNCGDNILDPGEECDDGNADPTDNCVNCMNAFCGDASSWTGEEECDDGNDSNTDSCLSTCLIAQCGDGKVYSDNEECDDGNDLTSDICLPTCQSADCGDAFVCTHSECISGPDGGMEECDDGPTDGGAQDLPCLPGCKRAQCGDGLLCNTDNCITGPGSGPEQCDDGNTQDFDGCSADCDRLIWRKSFEQEISAGIILSPEINGNPSKLILVHKEGLVRAVSPISGESFWSRDLDASIRANPVSTTNTVSDGGIPNFEQSLIALNADYSDGGAVIGLNSVTGEELWRYSLMAKSDGAGLAMTPAAITALDRNGVLHHIGFDGNSAPFQSKEEGNTSFSRLPPPSSYQDQADGGLLPHYVSDWPDEAWESFDSANRNPVVNASANAEYPERAFVLSRGNTVGIWWLFKMCYLHFDLAPGESVNQQVVLLLHEEPDHPLGQIGLITTNRNDIVQIRFSAPLIETCEQVSNPATEDWRIAFDSTLLVAPVAYWVEMGISLRIIVASADGRIVQLTSEAGNISIGSAEYNKDWEVSIQAFIDKAPLVVEGGNIYVAGSLFESGLIYALSSSGDVLWSEPLDGPPTGSPILHNGAIYIATQTGSLYAFETDRVAQEDVDGGTGLVRVEPFSPTSGNFTRSGGNAQGTNSVRGPSCNHSSGPSALSMYGLALLLGWLLRFQCKKRWSR